MDEKQFIDDILSVNEVDNLGSLAIEQDPVRLTVSDSLSLFSFYARQEFDRLRKKFAETLDAYDIQHDRGTLTMRLKSPGSILFKALWSGRTIKQIEDIFGFRFLTETKKGTYRIADALVKTYGLADARSPEWEQGSASGFMDWIKTPRQNGFRSLDYFLKTDRGFPLNVQGRTYEMERENEAGLGAHALYKQMQLRRFQVRCFQDAGYRREKISHLTGLVESLRRGHHAIDHDLQNGGQAYTYVDVLKLFVAPKTIRKRTMPPCGLGGDGSLYC